MNPNFTPETVANLPTSMGHISRKVNDFNDVRLSKTYNHYITTLVKSGTTSILRSTQSNSEAVRIYRFLKNEKVTMAELIEKSCSIPETTISGRHILVIGDSSIFNMNNHKNRITDMENMGKSTVGNSFLKYDLPIHCSELFMAIRRIQPSKEPDGWYFFILEKIKIKVSCNTS